MAIDKSLRQHYDVPNTKKIKGQLHRLAYITSDEAKALKKMGGIETRTPEGIIAYPGHHGSSGSSAGVSQGGGSSGGEGGRNGHHAPSPRPAPAPAPAPAPKPSQLGDTGGSLDHLISPKPGPDPDRGWQTYAIPEPKKIKDIVNLGDDAKTQHLKEISIQAKKDWDNKSQYEKEAQEEKWAAAQDKLKSTKGGGFWKTLGNLALAVLVPALLPAKLASTYRLVKGASWVANKIGLTDKDIVQLAQKQTGKNLSNLITGKEGFLKQGLETLGLKKTDTSKEYTEKTIGKGDDLSSIEGQTADLSANDIKLINYGKKHGLTTPTEIKEILGVSFNKEKPPTNEEIKGVLEGTITKPTGIFAAHGGRIDKPLMGRSRYI